MLMAALAASSPEELSWSMSANRGLTLACVPPAGALLSGGVTPIYACLYISINKRGLFWTKVSSDFDKHALRLACDEIP